MCFDAPFRVAEGNKKKSLHDYNARTYRIRARRTNQATDALAEDAAKQSGAMLGAVRAAAAAQGIDPGSGVAADIQGDVAYMASREVTRLRNNAALEAWGYRVLARGEDFQGEVAKWQGQVGAATSLLNAGAIYGTFSGKASAPTE